MHSCIDSATVVCAHGANAGRPSAMIGLLIMLALLAPTFMVGFAMLRGQAKRAAS